MPLPPVVHVYDLVKQQLIRKLRPSARWVTSMDIHPTGLAFFSPTLLPDGQKPSIAEECMQPVHLTPRGAHGHHGRGGGENAPVPLVTYFLVGMGRRREGEGGGVQGRIEGHVGGGWGGVVGSTLLAAPQQRGKPSSGFGRRARWAVLSHSAKNTHTQHLHYVRPRAHR